MQDGRFVAPLRALSEAAVEFILVGDFAAVCNGVPMIVTLNVDVVHARNAANVERLLAVLERLDATFRAQPERKLRPNTSHLSGSGHVNLSTNLGNLDVLCTIGQNLAYEDLLPYAEEMTIGKDLRVLVLRLEKLIEVKEQLNHEKDRAILPILRRTLQEGKKSGL